MIIKLFPICSLQTAPLKSQTNDHYRQMLALLSPPPFIIIIIRLCSSRQAEMSFYSSHSSKIHSNTTTTTKTVTMQRWSLLSLLLLSAMVIMILPPMCSSTCTRKRLATTCECLDACSAYVGDIYEDCAQFCSYNTEPLPRCMCEQAYQRAKNRNVHVFQVTGVSDVCLSVSAWMRRCVFDVEGKHSPECRQLSSSVRVDERRIWGEVCVDGVGLFLSLSCLWRTDGVWSIVRCSSVMPKWEGLCIFVRFLEWRWWYVFNTAVIIYFLTQGIRSPLAADTYSRSTWSTW